MVKPLAQLGDSKQAPKRRNGGRASARRTLLSHPSKHLPSQPVSRFEERVCDLSVKLDKLLVLQEESVKRLDAIGHEEMLSDLRAVMGSVREKVELQEQRLEGLERLFSGIQQLFGVFAEVVKRSFWAGGLKSKRKKSNGLKDKDGKEKSKPYPKVVKSHKKKKPQDGADSVHAGLEDVEKLNQQNDHFSQSTAGTSSTPLLDLIHEDPSHEKQDDRLPVEDKFLETLEVKGEEEEEEERIEKEEDSRLTEEIRQISQNSSDLTLEGTTESCEEHLEIISSAKRHVTDETLETDELKKSRVEETSEEEAKGAEEEEEEEEEAEPKDDALEAEPETPAEETEEERKDEESEKEEFVIDSSPPPPAPFEHRLVTPKTHQITSFYDINKDEVLGGGRFGVVHKCVEKSSGLILAAKVIKARSQKEKDVVKSEIEVMNQLNHANLIQLYGAFESRHEFILVMEYVDGGELFDRIIDENYKLTELDTVLFIRQISEGLQYMHKMYILHLDLKPENILCVSRETNKIKIIDFGLARRYKPREKLRVNFGTPEFLAPEVINYEFVSFPTDMWSLGVITYMLLSGLSPFLGEDDNETLNNILACQWSFEEAEFADISEEAKDFISRLLVKSKSWRMSASQSLKHPWLSDRALHYRLHHKKNKCHSSHAPPAEG